MYITVCLWLEKNRASVNLVPRVSHPPATRKQIPAMQATHPCMAEVRPSETGWASPTENWNTRGFPMCRVSDTIDFNNYLLMVPVLFYPQGWTQWQRNKNVCNTGWHGLPNNWNETKINKLWNMPMVINGCTDECWGCEGPGGVLF